MNSVDPQAAGKHFLDFTLVFYTMAQRHYRHSNQIKANTKAFQTLMTLMNIEETGSEPLTMSSLADELHITKQQMTKLVNDLEGQNMVERVHDSINRRQVYIHISDKGKSMMDELKALMLESTVEAMKAYTKEELDQLDHCLQTMTRLLGKLDIKIDCPVDSPLC